MADTTTSVGGTAVPRCARDRGTVLAGALLSAIALIAWATLVAPAIGWRIALPPMRGPDPIVAVGGWVPHAPPDGDVPGPTTCGSDAERSTTLTGWLSACAEPTLPPVANEAAAGPAAAAVRPSAALVDGLRARPPLSAGPS